ncbi:hypothetical protein [Nocardia carnea]|uniref:hypothetical protein n=1 Tax=Nocardia carnea TaxID=37328 RepID=UPI0024537DF8|nr:hypothetical protein [Nocardia carnea]
MSRRTFALSAGLAVLAIVLAATNWHPLRAGIYALAWAAATGILYFADRRHNDPKENVDA